MTAFSRLFTLVFAAAAVSAASLGANIACDHPTVTSTSTVQVGEHKVIVTDASCAAPGAHAAALTTPPVDVCGVSCTISCNSNAGTLPPITDDCQVIKNSITIFNGVSTTFTVAPKSIKTLTSGTCSFFLTNNATTHSVQGCWADLSTIGSRSGSACFPPVMPLHSEGICTAVDSSWTIGAAHSPSS